MNKIFQKLPLPAKLIALGIIPLIFLIYFATQIIREKQQRNQVVKHVIENINNAIAVNQLATQLHRERRYSFGYILDRVTSAELVAQQSKVDEAISKIERLSPEAFKSYQVYSLLGQLKKQRKLILGKQISSQRALFFYSNVLDRVHSLYNTSVENIPYLQSIGEDLSNQMVIFDIANQFGLIRNSVYSLGLKRTFTDIEFDLIEKEYELMNSLSAQFNLKSASKSKKFFADLGKSPEVAYINRTLAEINTNRRLPADFNAEYWWSTSADVVDELIQLEIALIESTKKNAESIAEKENSSVYQSIFLLVLIILLVMFIVAYTIRNIDKLISEIKVAAEHLSMGGTSIKLDIETKDSIGSLVNSIKLIDKNNRELTLAADEIGKGNFHVKIRPRGSEDLLGNSILKMRNDLMQFSQESARKIWIQSGLGLLNDSARGEKPIENLTKDALNALVNYLDAQVGLLYLSDQDQLNYSAGFALGDSKNIPRTIAYGENLLGQVATGKELIHLKDVPEDFLKISTALGETSPQHLIIFPLIQNDFVEGVIEIGSYKPFPEAAVELIEQSSVNLAIAIHTAKNRARLQELLEETQAQTEELQAQHSELENLNTELEAQAQKLQASEEELKVQQEELLEANQELEERSKMLEEKNELILERNLDIQKKAEELEISTRYKSEFLANMSHELRTPLNSILLLSRLLSENVEDNLTDDQIEYARVIQTSGNGLLALIDEILDLSKIEAGKMDLEIADTSVKEIANDMKSLFGPIAKEKNLDLRIELAADLPSYLETDKMRLEQILKNLLSNALKFTSKGYVKLGIQSLDNGSLMSFRVQDTGIGIPADKQKHVFEAFQQADGSTKRKFGGTGLGLSISKELSRLLGGEINLKSASGEGSEFTVTVPVRYKPVLNSIEEPAEEEFAVEAQELIQRSEDAERKKLTVANIPPPVEDDRNNLDKEDRAILIVEDDTNFAKALLSFTRKSNYKGLVAVRGDEGIEMAKRYKPTAILLDIQLPVKDGWEVMEELKADPATRHIPVHIMSSLEMKKESLVKGAVDFINKPVAIEQIQGMFSKLEDALSRDPKKVLIIEENPKHAKALAYFLETFNVHSEIKETVAEGISALQQNDVNCVILDMGIPDQTGYETLEEIKKNKGLENLPIIIFTGKNLSKAEESKLKQYAESIVMKTAHSYQRILDEVALFLHLVEEKTSKPKSAARKNVVELNQVLHNKTVLVADDDVRNIFSLTKALEQVKMNVISATDGKEALRMLEENPEISVVLMDMMMPEMDGYETTTRIRQNPKYKNLPILAVTAKAMIGDREKCIKAGASDYISKPVDIDQLISLLRVWLYDKNM